MSVQAKNDCRKVTQESAFFTHNSYQRQPVVWLIPIAVNGELNNPDFDSAACLAHDGRAMTDLFPWHSGEKWGGWMWLHSLASALLQSSLTGSASGVSTSRAGPWEHANPTSQPGQALLWQEHWDGQCWSTLAKPRPQLWTGSGGTAGKGGSCQSSFLGAAGVGCAKARAFVPGRDAWVAAGGKCTPSKARDHLQPGVCQGALQPT